MKIFVDCPDVQASQRFEQLLRGAGHQVVTTLEATNCPDALVSFGSSNSVGRAAQLGVGVRIAVMRGTPPVDQATLIVRSGLAIGRYLDPTVVAEVLGLSGGVEVPVVHVDDLHVVLLRAIQTGQTGELDVVAGSVNQTDLAAAFLGKPTKVGVTDTPGGFGWNARDTVEDFRAGAESHVMRQGKLVIRPGWIPLPSTIIEANAPATDDTELASANAERCGEFDGRVDPRFPVYSATNASEALPGALTPMTISVQLRALRAASAHIAALLGVGPITEREWASRVNSVFGHRIFLNASAGSIAGRKTPGWDEEAQNDQATFVPKGTNLLPLGLPEPDAKGVRKLKDTALLIGRFVALYRRFEHEVELLEGHERAEHLGAYEVAALSDVELSVRLRRAADRNAQAWMMAGMGVVLASATVTPIEKKHGREALSRLGIAAENLASAHSLNEVTAIGELLRSEPNALKRAAAGDVAGARAASAKVSAGLDHALAVVGHRGPGEGELINATFADRPELLLVSAAQSAQQPQRSSGPTSGPTLKGRNAARAARFIQLRERGRNIAVHWTNQVRLLVNEAGRRAASAGAFDRADDAFYLTLDELVAMPANASTIVARRRAERERLAALHLPAYFDGTWEPVAVAAHLAVGESLSGIAASPGVATGRVKLVRNPDEAELDIDEIMVAPVTDVGYTMLFAAAAAVVTDIGGVMSHAAIVAREFGIPCVVQTEAASTRLRNGQLIRVDGSAGTITVLED